MAGQLSANQDVIRDFANNCRDRHRDLETAVKLLAGRKEDTVATWSGQAKEAFNNLMNSYFEQARKLNDALDQTADKLTKAGQAFAAQDEQFAQQVKQQASSLTLP
ncbi:WXG100 family type VII secretion target [Nocardia sp. NPDC051052]|uniref:WXG100 family type VII secretion target n=1 Tax=Nocardia sp. NPDC051052 TaxID=3364322 RepID=UPI0037AB5C08